MLSASALLQVQAQQQRNAAAAAAQQAAAQQVIPGDINSLATLQLPEVDLPQNIATLNLTKLAPLLPLLAGLNASVVASWLPVVERSSPEGLALAIPAVNALEASTMEALLAALPYLNWETVVVILPLVNAIPADALASYIKLLQDVSVAACGWLWIAYSMIRKHAAVKLVLCRAGAVRHLGMWRCTSTRSNTGAKDSIQ